jgi:hypothetical protein
MPATNAWDETKPAGSDLASTIDNQTRQLKLDIRERLAVQHYWNTGLSEDGLHKEISITPATTNTALLKTNANQSLTGSSAVSAIDLGITWNTTGAPTALKINVTNTASDAAALLMDLQVGGVSQFKVSKAGVLTTTGAIAPAGGAFTAAVTITSTADADTLAITPTHAAFANDAIFVNTTRTSNAAFNLMHLQAGGTSLFTVTGAGLFTAQGVGTYTVGGGGTGSSSALHINGANAASSGAVLAFRKNGTTHGVVCSESAWVGGGSTSSNLAIIGETGNGISFFTNGSATVRFMINSDGFHQWAASAASPTAVLTDLDTTSISIYGTNDGVCANPHAWIKVVINSTVYKVPCFQGGS